MSFDKKEWHEATPGFWRRFAGGLRRDLIVLVGLAMCCEVALRVAPGDRPYVTTDSLTGGHPIALNSAGYRSEELPQPIPADRIPVLFLGNSTTFGTGVAIESTYAHQLVQRLNQGQAGPYAAVNAAGQGGSCWGALNFVRERAPEIKPRLVVMGLSASMITKTLKDDPDADDSSARKQSSPRSQWLQLHALMHRSYVYGAVDFYVRGGMYRLGLMRDRMDKRDGAIFAMAFDVPGVDLEGVERGYHSLDRCLSDLDAVVRQSGAELQLVSMPTRFRLSDEPLLTTG